MYPKENTDYNMYVLNNTYKSKFICCACRKIFKHKLKEDIGLKNKHGLENYICPHCGKQAIYVGIKFRAPKSDNLKVWRSIEVLHEVGEFEIFNSWFSSEYTMPESTKELKAFLMEKRSMYECQVGKWSRADHSEDNKVQVKSFSEAIKRIDEYLKWREEVQDKVENNFLFINTSH